MPTAHADVSIDRPSRYLVQLCEHLNQFSDHARHGPTTTALQVRRELRRMQELFAARLETIGRRDNPILAWVPHVG